MEATKILNADILDIVFEYRNKEYGAYELRKTYNKRIAVALIVTASIAIISLGGSVLANNLKPVNNRKLIIKDYVLENVLQEKEEKKVEPLPVRQEQPKVETIRNTPPKIVRDEDVKKDEIPPETKELENSRIDLFNQEGIKDEGLASVIDQDKQVIEEKKVEDEDRIFTSV